MKKILLVAAAALAAPLLGQSSGSVSSSSQGGQSGGTQATTQSGQGSVSSTSQPAQTTSGQTTPGQQTTGQQTAATGQTNGRTTAAKGATAATGANSNNTGIRLGVNGQLVDAAGNALTPTGTGQFSDQSGNLFSVNAAGQLVNTNGAVVSAPGVFVGSTGQSSFTAVQPTMPGVPNTTTNVGPVQPGVAGTILSGTGTQVSPSVTQQGITTTQAVPPVTQQGISTTQAVPSVTTFSAGGANGTNTVVTGELVSFAPGQSIAVRQQNGLVTTFPLTGDLNIPSGVAVGSPVTIYANQFGTGLTRVTQVAAGGVATRGSSTSRSSRTTSAARATGGGVIQTASGTRLAVGQSATSSVVRRDVVYTVRSFDGRTLVVQRPNGSVRTLSVSPSASIPSDLPAGRQVLITTRPVGNKTTVSNVTFFPVTVRPLS